MIKLAKIGKYDIYSLSMQECKEQEEKYPCFVAGFDDKHTGQFVEEFFAHDLNMVKTWCKKH